MSSLRFRSAHPLSVGGRYSTGECIDNSRPVSPAVSTRALKSIVVSGGYEDDGDYGNAGLMKSRVEGLPVRVVRGAHPGSAFAPETNGVPEEPRHQGVLSWGPSSSERGFDVVRCHYVPPSSTAPPCGAGSSQRNRNRSFHSGSVGTEAHGATPIAQRGEVVASKMPHLFAAVY